MEYEPRCSIDGAYGREPRGVFRSVLLRPKGFCYRAETCVEFLAHGIAGNEVPLKGAWNAGLMEDVAGSYIAAVATRL